MFCTFLYDRGNTRLIEGFKNYVDILLENLKTSLYTLLFHPISETESKEKNTCCGELFPGRQILAGHPILRDDLGLLVGVGAKFSRYPPNRNYVLFQMCIWNRNSFRGCGIPKSWDYQT